MVETFPIYKAMTNLSFAICVPLAIERANWLKKLDQEAVFQDGLSSIYSEIQNMFSDFRIFAWPLAARLALWLVALWFGLPIN